MNHYEKKSVNPSIIIPPNMWYEYLEHGKEIRFDPARDDFNLTTGMVDGRGRADRVRASGLCEARVQA